MNADLPLFSVVIAMIVAAIWLISTAPDITEERKEMEDEW